MSAPVPPDARRAMELARQGDIAGAIVLAETTLAEFPDDAGLHMFTGVLHSRRQAFDHAVRHFRRASDLLPGDPLPRLELARALIGIDALDEAERLIGTIRLDGAAANEIVRVRALLHRRRGEFDQAAALYGQLVAANSGDFDSWAHLGECRIGIGDPAGAVTAFQRALNLSDQRIVRLRLADAQAAAGQAEAGLVQARAHAAALPEDAFAQVVVARFEDLLERPAAAEQSLQEALALDPGCEPALLALGNLLERTNRLDELDVVLARVAAAGIAAEKTALLRARLLKRRGDLEAALAAGESAPATEDAGGRAQLLGEIRDRLGDHAAAFAAFTEMNRRIALEVADARRMSEQYRATIARLAAMTTSAWYASWSPAVRCEGRPPAFMFGFPRSGTTLLDTMLMGHGDALVLEEPEILPAVSRELAPLDRLPAMDRAAIIAAREKYIARAEAFGGAAEGRLIIDKSPLGSTGAPLAHRMFPEARFIFVERHPCDVVLSCFMTRMRPDIAGANFLTLEDAAKLYDAMLGYWEQCRAIIPLAVHAVRYERMIEDAEAELRPLAAFLGLAWDPAVLDHVSLARARGYISTPSYAQVAQPIYTHARGRWESYRAELAPVLPLLAPWAEKMGYPV